MFVALTCTLSDVCQNAVHAGSESEDLSRQPSSMVDGFENYNDDNGSDSGLPGKSARSSETSGGEPAS